MLLPHAKVLVEFADGTTYAFHKVELSQLVVDDGDLEITGRMVRNEEGCLYTRTIPDEPYVEGEFAVEDDPLELLP